MDCIDARRHSTVSFLDKAGRERRHLAVAANRRKTAHWARGDVVQSGRVAKGASAASSSSSSSGVVPASLGVGGARMSQHQRLLLQQQLQQQRLASSPYFQQLLSQHQLQQEQHHQSSVPSTSLYNDPTLINPSLDYSSGTLAATGAVASAQPSLPFFQHQPSVTSNILTGQLPLSLASFCNTDNTNSNPLYYQQLLLQQQQQQLQLQNQQQQYYDLFSLQPQQSQFVMSSPQQQQQADQASQVPLNQEQDASSSAVAASLTEEQLAEYQKLSSEYEPEVIGPLVGQRQPSTAITTEYASADPAYQRKTAALPQKYSHYRGVRGDGRCGWRAIAFGYFETLVTLADNNKFVSEEARLRALSTVLNSAGFDPMLYEDFADETFELLQHLATASASGTAETALLDTFNDEGLQNYIITHLKEDYLPWLLGQSVESYTDNSVMPILSEIDHVSLNALNDVFLSPASISLEVLYLDRSEGDEVNMHQFSPLKSSETLTGTIRLLYRPGHYDILYKQEDLPVQPAPVTTYLQYGSTTKSDPIMPVGVSDYLTMIPGISFAGPPQSLDWRSGSSTATASSDFQVPSSGQQKQQKQHRSTTPVSAEPTPSLATSAHSRRSSFLPLSSSMMPPSLPGSQPIQTPQLFRDLSIRRRQSLDSALQHLLPTTIAHSYSTPGPFRSSAWELEPDFLQLTSQGPPRTRAFQNSHYNTAHFMNPAFQPEEWRPDGDEAPSLRHRNSH